MSSGGRRRLDFCEAFSCRMFAGAHPLKSIFTRLTKRVSKHDTRGSGGRKRRPLRLTFVKRQLRLGLTFAPSPHPEIPDDDLSASLEDTCP
jgi:hypothetical protein